PVCTVPASCYLIDLRTDTATGNEAAHEKLPESRPASTILRILAYLGCWLPAGDPEPIAGSLRRYEPIAPSPSASEPCFSRGICTRSVRRRTLRQQSARVAEW